MSTMYILLLPLASLSLYKRIRQIVLAIKKGNNAKLKADLLFLVLQIVVIGVIVLAIEGKLF